MKQVKQTLPGAWICTNDPTLTYSNHGRKSVQHSKIYLNDGEEFEIELYNPLSENVLAIISLDGKPISKSGIVVRAGQRFYLDCFYDDQKKFVFKTYNVENTVEASNAIAKNGLFEVQFYKEKILKKYEADKIVQHHHHYHDYYYPRPYYWNGWYNGFYYVNGSITASTGASTTTLNYNPTLTYSGGTGTVNLSNISTTTANATYTTNTSGLSFTSNQNSQAINDSYTANLAGSSNLSGSIKASNFSSPLRKSASLETGQVDKGSSSNQVFQNVEMDFEDAILNKITYQLLPESRKPLEFNMGVPTAPNTVKINAESIELNGNVKVNGVDSNMSSKISQLLELKAMLESQLITSSEFDTLKKELLG